MDSPTTHANARYGALKHALSIGALLASVLLATTTVFADGGSLLVRKQVGSLIVSIFGADVPLRVGKADLSVMVQKASDQSAVMDAAVMLRLAKSTPSDVTEVAAPATHAKATNKTFYAAQIKVPSAGPWRLSAEVTAGGSTSGVNVDLNILPPAPPVQTYWMYFALVPFTILLFVFNRWLRARTRSVSRRVQP